MATHFTSLQNSLNIQWRKNIGTWTHMTHSFLIWKMHWISEPSFVSRSSKCRRMLWLNSGERPRASWHQDSMGMACISDQGSRTFCCWVLREREVLPFANVIHGYCPFIAFHVRGVVDEGDDSGDGSGNDGDGYVIAQAGCDGPKLTRTTIESSKKNII